MTGEELKQAQAKLGMSNVDLSDLSGYRTSVISRMRGGKQPVPPQLSRIVKQALEIQALRGERK